MRLHGAAGGRLWSGKCVHAYRQPVIPGEITWPGRGQMLRRAEMAAYSARVRTGHLGRPRTSAGHWGRSVAEKTGGLHRTIKNLNPHYVLIKSCAEITNLYNSLFTYVVVSLQKNKKISYRSAAYTRA